jgi:hypothetical protein
MANPAFKRDAAKETVKEFPVSPSMLPAIFLKKYNTQKPPLETQKNKAKMTMLGHF